jgi:hypothetical protein
MLLPCQVFRELSGMDAEKLVGYALITEFWQEYLMMDRYSHTMK